MSPSLRLSTRQSSLLICRLAHRLCSHLFSTNVPYILYFSIFWPFTVSLKGQFHAFCSHFLYLNTVLYVFYSIGFMYHHCFAACPLVISTLYWLSPCDIYFVIIVPVWYLLYIDCPHVISTLYWLSPCDIYFVLIVPMWYLLCIDCPHVISTL